MNTRKFATTGYVTDDPSPLADHDPPDDSRDWRLVSVNVVYQPKNNYRYLVMLAWESD